MNSTKALTIALVALVVLVIVIVVRPSCSAHAQTVEVIPSTQPATTTADGQIVVAPPSVKIDGGWTPANTMTFIGWLIPTIMASIASGLGLWYAIRSKAQSDSNSARLDRQGETQKDILKQMPPPPGGL